MKKLTEQEILDAPEIVQHIYVATLFGTPIGFSLFDEAVTKHPEYFPDVIEHRAKWNAIPQEVHDAMHKELKEQFALLYPDSEGSPLSCSKGFLYWAKHPQEYELYRPIMEQRHKAYNELEILMYEKYYAAYGIEHPLKPLTKDKNKQHGKGTKQGRKQGKGRHQAGPW